MTGQVPQPPKSVAEPWPVIREWINGGCVRLDAHGVRAVTIHRTPSDARKGVPYTGVGPTSDAALTDLYRQISFVEQNGRS